MKDIPCFNNDFSLKKHHGAACWVAGWGATRYGGGNSQNLFSIGLNLMDIDYCRDHSFYDSQSLQNDELCAGLPPTEENNFNRYENRVIDAEKNYCQGDSGGPLICDVKGVAVLVGVVSWGVTCGKEGYPGIFSNVHYHRDWIESVTLCGDTECLNGGFCEFDQTESKGVCVCPAPWTGVKCEDVDSNLCWDKFEKKITSGLTSLRHKTFNSQVEFRATYYNYRITNSKLNLLSGFDY